MTKTVALYLRVSTSEQTVENQRREFTRLHDTRGEYLRQWSTIQCHGQQLRRERDEQPCHPHCQYGCRSPLHYDAANEPDGDGWAERFVLCRRYRHRSSHNYQHHTRRESDHCPRHL